MAQRVETMTRASLEVRVLQLRGQVRNLETSLLYAAGQLSGAMIPNWKKHPEEVYDELKAYRDSDSNAAL